MKPFIAGDRKWEALLALAVSLAIGLLWLVLPHPLLAVVLGVAPLAILLVIGKPYLFVLAFVIFSFFRIHEAFPVLYSLRIPQLLAIATLATLSWHLFLSRSIKPFWSRELTWFSIFFFLTTVGIPLASNRALAMSEWSGVYVKVAIMTLAISWMTSHKGDFSLMARMVALAGALIGWVALHNKANSIGLVEGTRVTIGRDIGSILGDPNDLSLVLLFPASFALALASTPGMKKWERLLGILALLVIIMAIIATQSRGGLLGIATVMGVTGMRIIKSKIVLLSLGGLALLVLFAMAGISDRASGGAHEEGVDESAMGRIYAWGAAMRMGLRHPLTGVGINNFLVNYYAYSSHWDGKNHAVHSTWFSVLAETGILGLVVFLTMVTLNVRSALTTLNHVERIQPDSPHYQPIILAMSRAVLSGFSGFIISGTFLNQSLNWPFYVLMALNVATTSFAYREVNSQFAMKSSSQLPTLS